MEDPDPVVQEVPVFLAKGLENSLQLWQYPVRPAHMSYDSSTVIASRVKPGQQQVELTVALDTDTANYDRSKGEQVALNVDGSDARAKTADPDAMLYPSGIMDKQVLSSAKSVPDPSRYAVGILGGNEFHLTPIASILTIRPDLKYLDKSDRTARAEGRPLPGDGADEVLHSFGPGSAGGGAGGVGDPAAGDADIKPVTVRFAKGDPDVAKKMRERSFEYQQRRAEEEPWVQTRLHHIKSAKWEEESQRLFCKKMDDEILTLNQNCGEYLNSLTKS